MTTKARDFAEFAADVPTSIGSAGQILKINAGASAYVWGDSPEAALNIDASGNPTLGSGVTADEVKTLLSAASTAVGDPAPNWASPTATYTSSGTWSKPAGLSDNAIVWLYGVGGGQGGGTSSDAGVNNTPAYGGRGGYAFMVQCKASQLHGSAYVIGAGGNGGGGGTTQRGANGGATTVTINSVVYSSGTVSAGGSTGHTGHSNISGVSGAGSTDTANYFAITYPALYTSGFNTALPSDVVIGNITAYETVFSGGSGSQMAWDSSGGPNGQDSTYGGSAGDNPGNGSGSGQGSNQQGSLPTIPGGGGSPARGTHPSWGNTSSPAGRPGAQGNIRIYHA